MKTIEEFAKHYKINNKKEAKKDYDLYKKNLSFFKNILTEDKKNPGEGRGLDEGKNIPTTYKRL
jgi:FMN-dependent NADH-azoreductase